MLKEIRIHGRGGQGVVTSSELLAIAAFNDKKQSQAFPNFGVERSGAPIMAYARISDEKISLRQQVYEPDYVIVLDASLLSAVDVAKGLKANGLVIVNSDKKPPELAACLSAKAKVISFDVSKKAIAVLGKPLVNVAVLGVFAAHSKEITLPSLLLAIGQEFEGKKEIAEKNKRLAKEVFEESLETMKMAVNEKGKKEPK